MSINSRASSNLALNRLSGLASQAVPINGFGKAGYYQISILLSDSETLEGSFLVEFPNLNALRVSQIGSDNNATWSPDQLNVPQVHIRVTPRRSSLPQFEIILIAAQTEFIVDTQSIRATGAPHTGATVVYVHRLLP